MKKLLFLFLAATLSFASCSSADEQPAEEIETKVIENITPENSISGVYSGTLPCADCPGIEITLKLKANNKVAKTTLYLESNDTKETVKGTYKVKNGNVIVVRLPDGQKEFYRIKSDTSIVMLNSNKEEVTGELAEAYVLTKKGI